MELALFPFSKGEKNSFKVFLPAYKRSVQPWWEYMDVALVAGRRVRVQVSDRDVELENSI